MDWAFMARFLPLYQKADVLTVSLGAAGIATAALAANVIFLLRETSVFSAVSLMDLMFTAKNLTCIDYNTTDCTRACTAAPLQSTGESAILSLKQQKTGSVRADRGSGQGVSGYAEHRHRGG